MAPRSRAPPPAGRAAPRGLQHHFGWKLLERSAQLDDDPGRSGGGQLGYVALGISSVRNKPRGGGQQHLAPAQKSGDVRDLPRMDPANLTLDVVLPSDDSK